MGFQIQPWKKLTVFSIYSEKAEWQKAKETLTEMKTKLEEQKQVDSIKIQQFNVSTTLYKHLKSKSLVNREISWDTQKWAETHTHPDGFCIPEKAILSALAHSTHQDLLNTLEKEPEDIRRHLSEAFRKVTVLTVNEMKLTRRYTTLLEQEQHLRKENSKLKEESSHMRVSVIQRIGHLQRYKVAIIRLSLVQTEWGFLKRLELFCCYPQFCIFLTLISCSWVI